MPQRPPNFNINPDSNLAQGLVFAGLGKDPGNVTMFDSSRYLNNGTLTNMTPSSDWLFVPELGRWATDYNSASEQIQIPGLSNFHVIKKSNPITVAGWIKVTQSTSYQYGIGPLGKSVDWTCGLAKHWLDSAQNNSMIFQVREGEAGSSTVRGVYLRYDYTTNVWYHFAVIWEYISGYEHRATFYINGQNISSGTVHVYFATDRTGSGIICTPAFYGGEDRYRTGSVADSLLFDRALSANEIADLADPSNVYLSGLIEGRPRVSYFLPITPEAAPTSSRYRYFVLKFGGGFFVTR